MEPHNGLNPDDRIDTTITVEEHSDDNRALALIHEPYRHPLYTKKKKKYVKEVQKELALDAKLGLKTLSKDTAKKTLTKDIDDLTNSRDYCEITKNGLYRLFGIRWMNLNYCVSYNIQQKLGVLFEILLGTSKCRALASVVAGFLPLAILGYAKATWDISTRWQFLGNTAVVLAFAGLIISILFWLMEAFEFKFEEPKPEDETRYTINPEDKKKKARVISYTKIGVTLKVVPLDETEIDIPWGAKLKTAEALDTKIFRSFVIAYPKFQVERHRLEIKEKIIPRIDIDPAICGVTEDGRLFMVVCWDIKHDKDKTKKSIKRFKRFKIKV
jgi:hypothetical protein